MGIYIIEEDLSVRQSLTAMVESAHYAAFAFEAAEPFFAQVDTAAADGCLLCDLELPGLDAVGVLDELLRRRSGLRTVVMTGHGTRADAVRAMRAGASDVMEKPLASDRVLHAVRLALTGPPPPGLLRARGEQAADLLSTLSPRERDVFDLIVAGRMGKQAALTLGLSPRTVEVHKANIMRRLRITSLAGLVRLGLLAELLGEDWRAALRPTTGTAPSTGSPSANALIPLPEPSH